MGGYGGGYYHGRRSGGCLGGALSTSVFLIFTIVMFVMYLFSSVRTGFDVSVQEGSYRYDENTFQDYADAQYAAEFGSYGAYEDNLLITVLVEDEAYYDYYYIAWVGDHIVTDINYMMGGNDTHLGRAMSECINESSYKYSLDSNLAQVMESLTAQVRLWAWTAPSPAPRTTPR